MRSERQRKTWAGYALCLVALAVALAGCGSASASSSASSSSGSATASSTASSAGDAGIAKAKATVAQFASAAGLVGIPTLPKRAPKKTVAWVFCTDPTCQAGAAQQAFTTLGWNFKLVPWASEKGPADFVRAFNAALQMNPKPDFIGVPQLFPAAVDAKQLAQAKADHIPVVDVTSTTGPGNGVVACMSCAPELNETARLQVDVALADAGGTTGIVYGYDPTLGIYAQQFLPSAEAEVKKLSPESTFHTLKLSVAAPPTQNAATVVNFLRTNPNVKYVVLAISELGYGLPQALSTAGLSGKVKIIVQAPQPTDLGEIAKGQEFAAVGAENAVSMWRAAEALALYSSSGKIPSALVNPAGWHQIITKSNVSAATSALAQPPNYKQTFEKAWHVGG